MVEIEDIIGLVCRVQYSTKSNPNVEKLYISPDDIKKMFINMPKNKILRNPVITEAGDKSYTLPVKYSNEELEHYNNFLKESIEKLQKKEIQQIKQTRTNARTGKATTFILEKNEMMKDN